LCNFGGNVEINLFWALCQKTSTISCKKTFQKIFLFRKNVFTIKIFVKKLQKYVHYEIFHTPTLLKVYRLCIFLTYDLDDPVNKKIQTYTFYQKFREYWKLMITPLACTFDKSICFKYKKNYNVLMVFETVPNTMRKAQ